MKYYHYTLSENLSGILKSGVLKDNGEGVYVCRTEEDLRRFISLYKGIRFATIDDIVGIEFETDLELEESFDHNADLMGGARAFVSYEDVPISIINVFSYKSK